MAMQPTQPQGLLGQLGIQRQDPTAQGETALPFYQRGRFGNTMGNLAMAFNSLRQNPDENIPRIVTGQRAAREQDAANNRTIEWFLSQPDGARYAEMAEAMGTQVAFQAYQADAERARRSAATAAELARGEIKEVDGRLVRVMADGTVQEIYGGDQTPEYRVVRGSELGFEGPAADRLFNEGPDGKVTAIGGGDINARSSVGLEALDKQFAETYATLSMSGLTDARSQASTVGAILEKLEAGEQLTGPLIGAQPDFLRALTNPDAQDAIDRVGSVVQRSLREILGGQFAQREGEQLVRRAYNPSLPPEMNAARLRALFAVLDQTAQNKMDMATYYQENNYSLGGYSGNMLIAGVADIDAAMDAAAPLPTTGGATHVYNPETGGVEPL